METLLTILREVHDPRDMNARHCCASMLFIALIATLCGAKTCVDIADFAAANEAFLAEIADLPHGAAKGVVAIDGKRLRRGYERGRAFMPPLMLSVWDAETRLSLAARASSDGNEVKAALEALKSLDLKGCTVTADALHCHPEMAKAVKEAGGDYMLKLK